MTPLEEEYFTELTRDRTENANTLDKPSMQGAKDNAVEKYSDQAHFIYELLQNADDAGATHARFILENNRLIFSHNGTRHFSISDPSTEKADAENGCLGDVNSITSIGNSSKSVSKSKIGKFGVGFKAVFQYTSTPHIYDGIPGSTRQMLRCGYGVVHFLTASGAKIEYLHNSPLIQESCLAQRRNEALERLCGIECLSCPRGVLKKSLNADKMSFHTLTADDTVFLSSLQYGR